MRRFLFLLLLLAACTSEPAPATRDVGQFARDQLAATADDTDAAEINNVDFADTNDDFADLLR